MAIVSVSSKSRRARKQTSDADRELIQTSFKRFKLSQEAESDSRKKGLEDLNFSIGTGQWDEAVRANREIEGKPCLTMNRAPTFLRQFTGEERQHRPAMIVDPVGDGADAEVAAIHQGVLRHIETVSFADTVYDNAFDMMLRIGWSNWRVDMDYLDEMSFLQEPRIVGIENPFAVYMSPIRKPDGSDPLWTHVVQDLGKDEYKEKYGESTLGKMTSFPSTLGNQVPGWVTKDGVRIAEYWYLELEAAQLVQLDDGKVLLKKNLAKADRPRIVNERDTVTRKVCWIKHNAIEILERREYLGKYIPILELNGVRLNVNGTIYKAGFVRDYRDAQRIYDFMVTRAVEQVDLTGKDPLLVAFGSIDGREEEYRQMNRKNYPYLYYRAYDKDGKQLPPPTRANREPPIQAMHALVQQADYDMKAIVGIYGTGPGENATPNESEFAVLTRQQQTDTGMVNWTDNLNRTIRWQGKICIDLWPKYIDAARVQRIINPDDSVKHVAVYNSQMNGQQPTDAQALFNDNVKKAYDVGVGTYDVSLSTGPQYRTARQEAFRAIGAVVTSQPQLFPILGDIWIKYADWPGAHVLSERLKKMLPPNLQEQDDTDPKIQVLNLQGQLQALSQQQQQLVAELARATDTIRTNRLDVESKERIALAKNQSDMAIAQLKANAEGALAHMQATMDAISGRLDALHANMSVEQEAGQAPVTPELPNKVEPHVQPVTPATPTVPVPGTSGGL